MKKRILSAILFICMLATIVFPLSACKGSETVLTIGDYKVSLALYNYFLNSTRDSFFENYGQAFPMSMDIGDGTTVGQFIKMQTESTIKELFSLKKISEEKGLNLNDDDKQSIKDQKKSYIDNLGGSAKYNTWISDYNSTDAAFSQALELFTIAQKAYNIILGEISLTDAETEELKQDFETDYISARHILFATVDLETGDPLSDEEKASKKSDAEKLLADLLANDNGLLPESTEGDTNSSDTETETPVDYFVSKIDGNSSDGSSLMTFNLKNNSALPSGSLDEDFVKGCVDLELGKITTALIESQFGYHIVKRFPLDETQFDTLKNSKLTGKYGDIITEKNESMSFVPSDKYESLMPVDVA